jgi:peptide chain release factor subunit 1
MASQIPTTTKPSPDQAHLQELTRRLAEVESPEAPVLSIYLDVRPEVHGEAPARRPQFVVIRDQLRRVAGTYRPHSPARSSFDADTERILRYLDDGDFDGVEGVGLFACHAAGLWDEVRSPIPFEVQASAAPTADLFQLATLLADSEAAVVALVDSNTCRLFATRRGALREQPGPDEPPDEHRRHDQGGWSQARYQRHIDMQDKRFAAEAAAAIEKLVDEINARHLVLAGDERTLPVLQAELSPRMVALVEAVEHIGMRTGANEVAREVEPILAAIRRAEEEEVADRVIGAVRSGDLGAAGIDAVASALELGQVHELVIDRSADVDDELRAELVRQAALTSAEVITVQDHQGIIELGGVGATLRFRI